MLLLTETKKYAIVTIYRNKEAKMAILEEISENIINMSQKEIIEFFEEIMTKSEIEALSKRWRIIEMLDEGYTQREIAKELGVSLCKVTRGAKILKKQNSVTKKIIERK